ASPVDRLIRAVPPSYPTKTYPPAATVCAPGRPPIRDTTARAPGSIFSTSPVSGQATHSELSVASTATQRAPSSIGWPTELSAWLTPTSWVPPATRNQACSNAMGMRRCSGVFSMLRRAVTVPVVGSMRVTTPSWPTQVQRMLPTPPKPWHGSSAVVVTLLTTVLVAGSTWARAPLPCLTHTAAAVARVVGRGGVLFDDGVWRWVELGQGSAALLDPHRAAGGADRGRLGERDHLLHLLLHRPRGLLVGDGGDDRWVRPGDR